MTDDLRSSIAYYVVLVAFTLTAVVVIILALLAIFALAEWAVGVVMWLADNPDERDLATIGVLALLMLAAGEYRRKR